MPSNTWGGQGLLGVSIRFCSFEGANENMWHVLEVQPNSPASLAGLLPHTDYILGCDAMGADDDLYSVITSNDHRTIRLFVYNSESDRCREVSHQYWLEHCCSHWATLVPCSFVAAIDFPHPRLKLGRRRQPWLWHWIRLPPSHPRPQAAGEAHAHIYPRLSLTSSRPASLV